MQASTREVQRHGRTAAPTPIIGNPAENVKRPWRIGGHGRLIGVAVRVDGSLRLRCYQCIGSDEVAHREPVLLAGSRRECGRCHRSLGVA